MRDQASALRKLIHKQVATSSVRESSPSRQARVIGLIGGKGGVGTSNLAINLAIALAQPGARVCVWEANAGRGQLELLCGTNGYWNFSHVLTGARSLGEVIQKGPAGINFISNAGGFCDLVKSGDQSLREFTSALAILDEAYDFVIFDWGVSGSRTSAALARAADDLLLVCTPEPTAITEAYAWWKSFPQGGDSEPEPRLKLVVNRASPQQAREIIARFGQTAETFLHRAAPNGVGIADDPCVSASVLHRQPFVLWQPDAAASRDVEQLAKQLLANGNHGQRRSLTERLLGTAASGPAAVLAD